MNKTHKINTLLLYLKDIRDDKRINEAYRLLKEYTDEQPDLTQEETFHELSSLIKKSVSRLKNINKEKTDNTLFVSTGFEKLDKMTGGWEKNELVIIGSRPAIGKTSFLLNTALHMAKSNIPVGYISLELGLTHLSDRLLQITSQLPHRCFTHGTIYKEEWNRLEESITTLHNLPIYFEAPLYNDIDYILTSAIKMIKEKHLKALIIDYLQLIHPAYSTKRNREQEVSIIVSDLKNISRSYDIPVIVSSQLNRSVEMRSGSKRPVLSDLRESGSIEEMADKVILIYRPEVYGFLEDEEGNSLSNVAELIIVKNKRGRRGEVLLKFNKKYATFEDYSIEKRLYGDIDYSDIEDDEPF